MPCPALLLVALPHSFLPCPFEMDSLSTKLVADHCRTQEGIKRSMQLKDAMRETCLTDLAEAWYNLLTAYQSANPDLAAAVLNTVERYVNWIDVALVVNERCSRCCDLSSSHVCVLNHS